jgi:hypothetical protein
VSYKNYIITDLGSSHEEIERKINTDLLNGVWFADPKITEGLVLMTYKSRYVDIHVTYRGWCLENLPKNIYNGSKAISKVYWKPGDSHFWACLMAMKKILPLRNIFSKTWITYKFLGG